MRKKTFSEEQIALALRDAETGRRSRDFSLTPLPHSPFVVRK